MHRVGRNENFAMIWTSEISIIEVMCFVRFITTSCIVGYACFAANN